MKSSDPFADSVGMATVTTGLISGFDYGSFIDQMIAVELRPKKLLENRNTVLTTQQTVLHPDITPVAEHLPREQFLALLKGTRMLVGNSSAGLIESPAMGTVSIDIGTRQQGRERPSSVIHLPDQAIDQLAQGINHAMSRQTAGMSEHPYGDGHSGQRIARILAETDLQKLDVRKCCTF